MMPPPPPGSVAKPTTAALFPGTSAAVERMVAGDPAPGYFYVVSPHGVTPTVKAEALPSGQSGLPNGITHAQRSTVTTVADSALIILGFNLRADDGVKWRWVDATAFAGLTFWARGGPGITDLIVTTVDASNIPVGDPRVGICSEAMMAACPGIPTKAVALSETWTQIKVRWSDLMHAPMDVPGPVDSARMGRIDLLFVVPKESTSDFFITGVKLATDAELR